MYYKKVTVGYVIQDYIILEDNSIVCEKQEFIAGDQIDYEDEDGQFLDVDTTKEVYCQFNMVQPELLKKFVIEDISSGVAICEPFTANNREEVLCSELEQRGYKVIEIKEE